MSLVASFFIGSIMASAGLYLLLHNMIIQSSFGLNTMLWHIGSNGYGLTSGILLVPIAIGIGFIFYDPRKKPGWIMLLGALAALLVGILMNIHISLKPMTVLEMFAILVLLAGGLGLFVRSLKMKDDETKTSAPVAPYKIESPE